MKTLFKITALILLAVCVQADLPMKIDTVRVDTVGWIVDTGRVHINPTTDDFFGQCDVYVYPTYPSTLSACHNESHYRMMPRVTPTLHYTTDTLYRLTTEQVQVLTDELWRQEEWGRRIKRSMSSGESGIAPDTTQKTPDRE